MGKLKCPCGNVISDVVDPCQDKSWLVSDTQLDKSYDDRACSLVHVSKEVWHCHDCGRIAIDKEVGGRAMQWFKPEEIG